MLDLEHPVIRALESVECTIAWKHHAARKQMAKMWQNNLAQRRKKNANVDAALVLKDTAIGYGAEIANTESGVLQSVNEIVDNPDELPYQDRMRDFVYAGSAHYGGKEIFFQNKTSNSRQPYWYISEDQMKSLERSAAFNHYLVITGYSQLADLHYHYVNRYFVDFKKFMSKPSSYLLRKAKYSYPFDADKAIEDGICYRF